MMPTTAVGGLATGGLILPGDPVILPVNAVPTTAVSAPPNTPDPTTTQRVEEEILHGLIVAGLIAAAVFVKNPASVARAGQIIDVLSPLIQSL